MAGWQAHIWNQAFNRTGPSLNIPYGDCSPRFYAGDWNCFMNGGLFYTRDTNVAYNKLQQAVFKDQIDYINRDGQYSFSGQLKNNFSDMFASFLPSLAISAIGSIFGGGRTSGHGHDGCSCG